MKTASPLSLLLFLGLSASAPVPLSHNVLTSSCPYESCREFLTKPRTSPTRLTNPHFPAHQLANSDTSNIIIENRPITPSSEVVPSIALSAEKPLSSAYLLSLSNHASSPTMQKDSPEVSARPGDALPAKPTSALPELRKEDAKRYWASLEVSRIPKSHTEEIVAAMPGTKLQCGSTRLESVSGGHYVERIREYAVREYSDLLVVGIVLLFVVIVICVETVEKLGNVGQSLLSRTQRHRNRHGAIYLQVDEAMLIAKKPFNLQPAPKSCTYKIQFNDKKGYSDSKSEAEPFRYDSDATARV